MNKFQIDSDSRLVWDFFLCQPGDKGVEIDEAKIRSWSDIQSAWDGMQRELEALHEANPDTELGDREPEDDEAAQ